MNKVTIILLVALCFILIDLYAWQGVKAACSALSPGWQKAVASIYWSITVLTLAAFFTYHFGNPYLFGKHFSTVILLGIFTNYLSKTFLILFVLIDDLQRVIRWAYTKISRLFTSGSQIAESNADSISRSEFLGKIGLITAAMPVAAMSWGIISGAHDYRIRKKSVYLPQLPSSLDGIRIGQISDIHSGSFWNTTAVKGGVEMLMKEKADIVLFTGDLVNNRAEEMREYMNVFDKIKAPLGVYSVFGNHDYGDYTSWPTADAKSQNLQDLARIHHQLGWNLLRNENRILNIQGEKIALLGVENWSAKGNFQKYGNLEKAILGSDDAEIKLLLSHDPSHWKAQVLKSYRDIAMTFSGHTHGMQFGVEIGDFKWSPVQYVYDEWAGLYESEKQYLYVNRGYGYLGYPGRIGIPPEITIIELKKG